MNKLTFEDKTTLVMNVGLLVFMSFVAGVVTACVIVALMERV